MASVLYLWRVLLTSGPQAGQYVSFFSATQPTQGPNGETINPSATVQINTSLNSIYQQMPALSNGRSKVETVITSPSGATQNLYTNILPNKSLNVTTPSSNLFNDTFLSNTLNTIDLWTTLTQSGGTVSQVYGRLTVNSSTTANAYALLCSRPSFTLTGTTMKIFETMLQLEATTIITNNTRYWGIGIPNTTFSYSTPFSNGYFFKLDSSGVLQAVCVSSNIEVFTSGSLSVPTDGLLHEYTIIINNGSCFFYIDNTELYRTTTILSPFILSFNLCFTCYNSGSTQTGNPTLVLSCVNYDDTSSINAQINDGIYPWRKSTINTKNELVASGLKLLSKDGFSDVNRPVPDSDTWIITTGGHLITYGGNSGGSSYLVISLNPLLSNAESILTSKQLFEFPIKYSIGYSASQRLIGQDIALELVGYDQATDTVPTITQPSFLVSASQATTVITLTLIGTNNYVSIPANTRVILTGFGDTRLNVGPVLVGGILPTSFTVTSATNTIATTTYNVGTAFQSGTTVTGVGTTFTAAMVGGTFIFNNGFGCEIAAFTNATTITLLTPQTVPLQGYTIYLGTFYNVGTASLATTGVVTGVGTTFTSAMVGGTIVFNDNTTGIITVFTSATSITITTTGLTLGAQSYRIFFGTRYSAGTASQTGFTITGTNTVFTTSMIGGIVLFNDNSYARILTVVNSTTLLTNTNQNISSQGFTVFYSYGIGTVTVADQLANAKNGFNILFENATATNASIATRRGGGNVRYLANQTISSTVGTQSIVSPYADAWNALFNHEFYGNFDELYYRNLSADSLAVLTNSYKITQSLPEENIFYKLRIRAKNNINFPVPIARILSAQKTAVGTAVITTDVNHNLSAGINFVLISGIYETGTIFTNTTAAVAVTNILSANSFTVAIGTTGATNIAAFSGGTVFLTAGTTTLPPVSVQNINNISSITPGLLTVNLSTTATTITTANYGEYWHIHGLSPLSYNIGTASQTGTTVTGVGTTWNSGIVGSSIVFNDGSTARITAYTSATSLTVDVSQNVSSQGYIIYFSYFYNIGTASQTATLITGSGTTFTSNMTGGTIVFNDGTNAIITGFISSTQLNVNVSQSVGSQSYRIFYGLSYNTGTASQTGNTITGVGTTFMSEMIGGNIVFSNGVFAMITGFVSPTQLTVSVSQSVSSQNYTIYYLALQQFEGPYKLLRVSGALVEFQYSGSLFQTIFTGGSLIKRTDVRIHNLRLTDTTKIVAEITGGRGNITDVNNAVPVTTTGGNITTVGAVTTVSTVSAVTTVSTVSAVTSSNLGLSGLVADVASTAITTNIIVAAIAPTWGVTYEVNIPVTVVSGINPTYDVVIQESDDTGTNWFDVYRFPTITSIGLYRSPKIQMKGNRLRYNQILGGSNPSFTRSVNRLQTNDTVNNNISQHADITDVFSSDIVSSTTSPISYNNSNFTGTIFGNVLTVTAVNFGNISQGQIIYGLNILLNTQITNQISGVIGGIGRYNVYPAQTTASTFITGINYFPMFIGTGTITTTNVLTPTIISGNVLVGQTLVGTSITPGTIVLAQATATTYTTTVSSNATSTTIIGNYSSSSSSFTGSITGNILTVTSMNSGVIRQGHILYGINIGFSNLTQILNQLTGVAGGIGTYTVSFTYGSPVASGSITGFFSPACTFTATITGGTTLNVTILSTGTIVPGQIISGTGVTAGTTVVSQTSGTAGGVGVYVITTSANVSSIAMTGALSFSSSFYGTISGTTLTVNATPLIIGSITPGQIISGNGVTDGTIIISQTTGTIGGSGTYTITSNPNITTATLMNANSYCFRDTETSFFTGSISGTTLTVSHIRSGIIVPGQTLTGQNISQTATFTGTIDLNSSILTVSSVSSGSLFTGMALYNPDTIYSNGTVSQTGNTVTGVGTIFTPDMVGGTIIFNDNTRATITGFTNSTTLTATPSQSVLSQGFRLFFGTIYSVGTAGQAISSFTITGTGTAFTSAMVGGTIVYANGASAIITGWTSGTSLTANVAPTAAIATQAYVIYNIPSAGNIIPPSSTASQSTTTVTGVSTNFTAALIGGTIVFANNATATITAVASATSMTVNISQTVSPTQSYIIYDSPPTINTGTIITGQLPGGTPGGAGIYTVSINQSIPTNSQTIRGYSYNTQIINQLSGNFGDVGTYTISIPQNVSSTNIMSYFSNSCLFTGVIVPGPPTILVVTAITTGFITVGMILTGTGVTAGSVVVAQLTGLMCGGIGTYLVNLSSTATSTTITGALFNNNNKVFSGSVSGNILTVNNSVGQLASGQLINVGYDINAGTQIINQLTGISGGPGTYTLNLNQTIPTSNIFSIPPSNGFIPTFGCSYTVNIIITSVLGTNPTLDVLVQESDDNGINWFNVYQFPRITAVGAFKSPKFPLRGNRIRYVQYVGGLSPVFTRSINRIQYSDSITNYNYSSYDNIDDPLTTITSNINSLTLIPTLGCTYNISVVIYNVSGINPTLDLQIQESADSGESWDNIYQFPRITSTGLFRSPKLSLRGNRIRYVQTLGGTNPSFTRSILRNQFSDNVTTNITQVYDRTINLASIGSVTTSLSCRNSTNVQLTLSIGTASSPPIIQLQTSDDNGNTWYNVGNTLTGVANNTVYTNIQNVQFSNIRAIVTQASATAVLNYVLLKGF